MKNIETELKFKVKEPLKLLEKIDGVRPKVLYIQDSIYNKGKDRLRVRKTFKGGFIDTDIEKTTRLEGDVKKVIEEKIKRIPKGYKLRNSYDKIRYAFKRNGYEIAVDFYSIGVFCEIEGNEIIIKKVAKELGLKNNIKDDIDSIYCKMCEELGFSPRLHWGFGK